MAKADRDPIHAVKAFLTRTDPQSNGRASLAAIEPQLREIYRRFSSARRFQEGIALSEALDRLKDRED